MAKVSICIPAYNNPAGVERLLDSVVRQSYTDFEVILTDDSAGDEVEKVFRNFETQLGNKRLVYRRNIPSLGAVRNWNRAVSLAEGEYIKIMHHDDYFPERTSLARFTAMLAENPTAMLAFSGSWQMELRNDPQHSIAKGRSRHISEEDIRLLRKNWRNLYLANTIGAPSAVIVRREFVVRKGIEYDPELTWLVDSDYYMQILSRGGDFTCTMKPLVAIGVSGDQLTQRVSHDPEIQCREYSYIYKKYNLNPAKREEAGNLYKEKLVAVLTEFHGDMETAEAELGVSRQDIREGEQAFRKKEQKKRKDTLLYLLRKAQGKLAPLTTVLFMIGLTLEIGVVLLDKSNWNFPYESYVFRLTFLFFFSHMLCGKFSRKEFLWILGFLALGTVSYYFTGRNEILRMTVFTAACRDLDIRRLMRYTLALTAAGCGIIFLLSAAGIYGVQSLSQDFGYGVEIRYCFGFGHPNALHCMAMMLGLLTLYLYGKTIHPLLLFLMTTANACLYVFTGSESGCFTLQLAIFLVWIGRSRRNTGAFPYFAAEGLFGAGLLFSLIGAVAEPLTPLAMKLDAALTGRVGALWDTTYHEGTLSTWRWFSNHASRYYFDMGWVRLVYWYGVIPAVIMIAVIFLLFRQIRKNRDMDALVLLLVCCLYTVLEAHLVSVYLLRNYVFFLIAIYAPAMFGGEKAARAEEI